MSDKARRDYGSGSVYERGNGRWVGTIEAGWTREGKRRRISVSAKTEAEVKRKLRDRIRDLEDEGGTGADPRVTVKKWSDEWLRLRERKVRPHTLTADRAAVRNWIVPTIGNKRLQDLAPADVRKVADAQRAKGGKTSSMKRTHSTLTKMLKDARAEGHRIPVRVVEVEAPIINTSDRTNIPVDDAIKMLHAAANVPNTSRWVVALLAGMRQAECLGLTWEQVDLDAGLLVLSWQMQPLPYRVKRDRSSGFRVPDGYECRQVKGRLHLVRPKSKAGWRVIPLVDPVVAALRKRREAGEGPHGLVWHNDNEPIDSKADDAAWYALQDSAGVTGPRGRHYTIHEARHSTASLLHRAGTPAATITAIIGHSSWASTNAYVHVDTGPMREALEAVAKTLEIG